AWGERRGEFARGKLAQLLQTGSRQVVTWAPPVSRQPTSPCAVLQLMCEVRATHRNPVEADVRLRIEPPDAFLEASQGRRRMRGALRLQRSLRNTGWCLRRSHRTPHSAPEKHQQWRGAAVEHRPPHDSIDRCAGNAPLQVRALSSRLQVAVERKADGAVERGPDDPEYGRHDSRDRREDRDIGNAG